MAAAMGELQSIDGSVMEGGGQVVRMAMSFSCLLQKPIVINNIRAGRSSPGLKPQHFTGMHMVEQLCGGGLTGCQKGATTVTFRPVHAPRGGELTADTGTAGSVTLLLQLAVPCALFATAPTRLTLRGGTNVAFAPLIEYTEHVFAPTLRLFGGDVNIHLKRRGYFPRGGGVVEAQVTPVETLQAVSLLQAGHISHVSGTVFTAGRHTKMADRLASAVERRLRAALPGLAPQLQLVQEPSAGSNAAGVTLVAATSGGCRLGGSALIGARWTDHCDREAADAAVRQILRSRDAGACVDQYCQDQCIILMALAEGSSRIRTVTPTLHTQTAIHIAQLMSQAKFTVEKCGDDACIIECEGIGHRAMTPDQ